MAEQFAAFSEELIEWIGRQHVFFVASAAPEGRINLSPKGHDSLRVLGPNELLWLNLTGSGNETAAHLKALNRLTLMWCAFEDKPRILRAYGSATAIHPRDPEWDACTAIIPSELGARQYYRVHVDLVQTSCGYAVPFMDYQEDRTVLRKWAEKRGEDGIEQYWADKNQSSIDGLPSGILQ